MQSAVKLTQTEEGCMKNSFQVFEQMKIPFSVLLLLIAISSSASCDMDRNNCSPLVITSLGAVQGGRTPSALEFLGIPYAE